MGIEKFRTTASLNGNVLDTGNFQEQQSLLAENCVTLMRIGDGVKS